MTYFDNDFLSFFKDLSANNNKDWFHENKKRYERSVKKPFYGFLADLIQALRDAGEEMDLEPKDCVSRINRDIRFSKDKTPYNLHFTAFLSPKGKKDKSFPGIYLRFSPESTWIMGGAYMPSKDQLGGIREKIAEDISGFRELIGDDEFTKTFGEIQGDVNKRVPKELKELVTQEPLLLNKQFYFMAQLPAETICQPDLLEQIMHHWEAAKPINSFLREAVGV